MAGAVFLAHNGSDKEEIRKFVQKRLKLPMLDEIRETYSFDSRSKFSVPHALESFFESEDYESAVRNAVSIGSDSDTIACIAGGIAQAYYKEIPKNISDRAERYIDMSMKNIIREFEDKYNIGR